MACRSTFTAVVAYRLFMRSILRGKLLGASYLSHGVAYLGAAATSITRSLGLSLLASYVGCFWTINEQSTFTRSDPISIFARTFGFVRSIWRVVIPFLPRRDDAPNSDGKPSTAPDEPRLSPNRSCQFVLLTTKAATTCFICARPSSSATPALSPFPALGRPPSPGFSERRSPTPPSPSSLSAPSPGQRTSQRGGQGRPIDGVGRLGSGLGGGSTGSAGGDHDHDHDHDRDHEHLDVFLRRSSRFNHDLLLASITRCVPL